jgi:putative transposase
LGLPSIRGELQGQIYLGSEAFIARIQANLSPEQSLDEIPRLQRRPLAKPLASYREDFADDTHTGMALAYLTGDYAMKAVAAAFDVHYTTVSRAVRTYELKRGAK